MLNEASRPGNAEDSLGVVPAHGGVSNMVSNPIVGYSACRGTAPHETRCYSSNVTPPGSACSQKGALDLDAYDACATGCDSRKGGRVIRRVCCKLNPANRHDVVGSRASPRSRRDP